jgi:hypothetical protein
MWLGQSSAKNGFHSRKRGRLFYLSARKQILYLGRIQAGVWEILKPNTLNQIIETMVERGEGALKVKELRV